MIGAGSVGFTRRLMYDILSVPELADTHFALMDISKRNLDRSQQLKRKRPDNSSDGRMRKMRRDHMVPGENTVKKDMPPPRSNVLKDLKDMRDFLEQ